jgi:hypothetical protein
MGDLIQIGHPSGQVIVDRNNVASRLDKGLAKMRPNEPGATGNNRALPNNSTSSKNCLLRKATTSLRLRVKLRIDEKLQAGGPYIKHSQLQAR